MLTLLTPWYGSLLLDEKGAVVRKNLFPADAGALAGIIDRVDAGEVVDEERKLAPDRPFRVVEKRLLTLPGATLADDGQTLAWLRDYAEPAREDGRDVRLLHEATLALGRRKVRTAVSSRDQHVVQAVDAIDELSAQANVVSERLREWYALHYPELVQRVERHEELAALVAKHGSREEIRANVEAYAGLESPMGADVEAKEVEAYRTLARSASTMYATRADLEKYLDEVMPEVAPNVTALVGAVLAARLIRHAGGLRDLAMMASGTVQTLGAEKALFRHIKEGKKPPKHGVIFAHQAIHRAPRWQRGNLSRALAGKISLAARADAFTQNRTLGQELAAAFEERAASIRQEHQKPSGRGGRGGPPRGRGGPGGPPRGRGGPPRGRGGPGGPPRGRGGPGGYRGGGGGGGGRGGPRGGQGGGR